MAQQVELTEEQKKEWKKLKKYVFIAFLSFIFVAFIYEKVNKPAPLTKEEIQQKKIENQFSSFNGKHRNLVYYVESQMNDASSFEHISTKYWIRPDHLMVRMSFRGKNAFGALVMNSVLAKVNKETGAVIEVEYQ